MTKYPTPTKPGFFWSKLVLPAEGSDTSEHNSNDDDLKSVDWEVVDVYVNGGDPKGADYLRVFVPGISKSQLIDAFIWGPEVIRPAELRK